MHWDMDTLSNGEVLNSFTKTTVLFGNKATVFKRSAKHLCR